MLHVVKSFLGIHLHTCIVYFIIIYLDFDKITKVLHTFQEFQALKPFISYISNALLM